MGGTLATIMAMLLLLQLPRRSRPPGVGGLEPSAMERTLVIMDESLEAIGVDVTIPCDDDGRPQP